jgi:hypothetical protein
MERQKQFSPYFPIFIFTKVWVKFGAVTKNETKKFAYGAYSQDASKYMVFGNAPIIWCVTTQIEFMG